MEQARWGARRAAAGVGLLIGLVLFVAAVVDGGMSTPSRHDLRDPAGATTSGDRSAPRPAGAREDSPSWASVAPSFPVPPPTAATGTALAFALTGLLVASVATDRHHRAPSLRAARHRGPPVVA